MSFINLNSVVMIVDDDPDVLELLKLKVKNIFPVEIITETNPAQALEILKKKDIPIVITDINMPKMNGVELLREINSMLKGIRVIVMSAGTSTINCIDCFRHGASDFLVKPFSDEELNKVLQNAMESLERWKQFIHGRKLGEGMNLDC